MILALVGQKGGSGKSTIAILVAAELAARGRRVLLVDADPQKTAATWGAVAAERGESGGPTVVSMQGPLHRPEGVPRLAGGYDVTVIDTPPRLAEVQRSALVVADLALLPCTPTAADSWALHESVKVLEDARELRPALDAAIVVTRKRAGTTAARLVRTPLEGTGVRVLRAELGLRQAFAEAVGAGMGIGSYAAGDKAAAELGALVDELLPGRTRKKGARR